MAELHDLTALEQAAAVRRREVSPVELVEHHLARVERLDPGLGAFVTVTDQAAREQAKEAERRVASQDPALLPPLLGVPTAIKDLNLTAGVRTMLGSRLYADFVPPVDAHVVELLRAAGTISLGKTNTPEFGLPCYTESAVAPPARTPWDRSRSAGGSSGGAAAAVAAGMVPFAQGSDGGGSIRVPASACGLVGIKVSRGRISNGPIGGDVTGLAWNGPLTRSVRDAAAMLDAMAVPMPGDPHWAPPLPDGATFLSYAGRDPGRLRIGRWAAPVIAETEVHPDCLAAYEEATRALVELGHEVEDVPAPFSRDVVPLFETVWAVGAHGAPVDPAREGELLPLTRWLRERGSAVSGPEFVGAVARLQMLSREWIVRAAGYDAVLSPTLASPPVPVGFFTSGTDPAEDFARQERFTPFTAVYNVTGQPAVSLPLHWSPEGLPIGVMLAGRPAGEAPLIALSAQLEDARPWVDRRPPGWN
ncbi:MAG TPA: amidase [Mycobacteriales bacterium]|nr:amidase [Mycobacteriales bacterium]